MLRIGTKLRVNRKEESIDNGCEGLVVGIQELENGDLAYILRVEVNPCEGTTCDTLCQVREGEFEIVDDGKFVDLDSVEFDR
jgi:hypothetical protein